jgi:hypothetical protein
MKKFLFGFLAVVFLVACDRHDNEDQLLPSFTNIATVENPSQSAGFYFRLDNNDLMWITSTNFPYYHPKEGQRIIANYSILSINTTNYAYNHKVALNDVYEVLTKGIFKMKPATQDSIGNDLIEIRDMWIGSNYLNVEFVYAGYNRIHFINLISDSTKTYTDGKVHLEFRHNANKDIPSYSRWGVVSFDLRSLKAKATADSVNLVIHTKEFGATTDKTYSITYKFGTTPMALVMKRISLPKNADMIH